MEAAERAAAGARIGLLRPIRQHRIGQRHRGAATALTVVEVASEGVPVRAAGEIDIHIEVIGSVVHDLLLKRLVLAVRIALEHRSVALILRIGVGFDGRGEGLVLAVGIGLNLRRSRGGRAQMQRGSRCRREIGDTGGRQRQHAVDDLAVAARSQALERLVILSRQRRRRVIGDAGIAERQVRRRDPVHGRGLHRAAREQLLQAGRAERGGCIGQNSRGVELEYPGRAGAVGRQRLQILQHRGRTENELTVLHRSRAQECGEGGGQRRRKDERGRRRETCGGQRQHAVGDRTVGGVGERLVSRQITAIQRLAGVLRHLGIGDGGLTGRQNSRRTAEGATLLVTLLQVQEDLIGQGRVLRLRAGADRLRVALVGRVGAVEQRVLVLLVGIGLYLQRRRVGNAQRRRGDRGVGRETGARQREHAVDHRSVRHQLLVRSVGGVHAGLRVGKHAGAAEDEVAVLKPAGAREVDVGLIVRRQLGRSQGVHASRRQRQHAARDGALGKQPRVTGVVGGAQRRRCVGRHAVGGEHEGSALDSPEVRQSEECRPVRS